MIVALVVGLLAGFLGSVPVAGPIAVLVVSRSLQGRVRESVLLGVGAAVAEAAYAFLAYWGFATFLADLPLLTPIARGLATLILFVLAVLLWRYKPSVGPALESEGERVRGWRSFLLGFSISAVNPTVILAWAAALGMAASFDFVTLDPDMPLAFAVGVAVGQVIWFGLASVLISRFRARLSPRRIVTIHRGMAVFVALLGLSFAISFVRALYE